MPRPVRLGLVLQSHVKQVHLKVVSMTFPFDDLNMRDHEHVEWVKSQRNPELWHVAAMAIVNTLGDPRGFLIWLMEQPETDRATAGYVFFGAYGSNFLRGMTEFSGEGFSDDEWFHAMQAICRRAANTGFANDLLGLHPGFETERQKCIDLIKSGQIAEGIAVPHALLETQFPPEKKLRYFVEDGTILENDPGPFLS